jgi:hypothetical protein
MKKITHLKKFGLGDLVDLGVFLRFGHFHDLHEKRKISCKTRIELMHLKQQLDYFTLFGFFIQLSHGSNVINF